MANNCWNHIEINGSQEDIARFRADLVFDDESYNSLLQVFDSEREGDNPRWFEMDINFDETYVTFSGDSAWIPALDLFTRISSKYPSFQIRYCYEEQGCNFAGWADIAEGQCSDNIFSYWEGIIAREGEEEAYHLITEFELDCYDSLSWEEFEKEPIYIYFTDNRFKHDLRESFLKMIEVNQYDPF